MSSGDPFSKPLGLADIMRDVGEIQKDLQFIRQLRNLDVIMPGGDMRRIQRSPRSVNAILDLRDQSSAVATITPSGWHGQATCSLETSQGIADATYAAIQAAPYVAKIVALWPFLGCDINTVCIPLIDAKGVGPATNTNFVDANFDQMTGLAGGITRYLNSHLRPSDLGLAGAGGIGWWEAGFVGTGNTEPMGAYKQSNTPDNRFCLDLRTGTRSFNWGAIGDGAGASLSASNGHWYGQAASSSDRKLYLDGALLHSVATLTSLAGNGDNEILMSGCNEGNVGIKPWGGRGECAYFTDGTLTADEIAQFHALIFKYLISPKRTGIVVPFTSSGGNTTIPNPDHPDNAEETDCEACINKVLISRVTGEPIASRNTGNLVLTRTE